MTDLPTLEAALKLADQDSPLPSLAGPALKVLRDHIAGLQAGLHYVTVVKDLPSLDDADKLPVPFLPLGEYGLEYINTGRPASDPATSDSATLTALIAELRGREVRGRGTYGTDVDRTDLTNAQWRQHLREELMDALLYSLAEERTATIYGIDHGTDDKTVEMFGQRDANGVLHIEDIVTSEPNSPNSGHGHVRRRPDGVVAKCGGPMLCRICAKELADMFEIPGGEKCWCGTCYPITITNMRMVLCPTCGNKRCPHAHDHRNACTGSNAVGQPGSSWEHVKPTTPPAPEDC